MPVTVTADGKEYKLGYGVWMLQSRKKSEVELAFKDAAKLNPGTYFVEQNLSMGKFTERYVPEFLDMLPDMGWQFQNERIKEFKAPEGISKKDRLILEQLIEINSMAPIECVPRKLDGEDFASFKYYESELPDYIRRWTENSEFLGIEGNPSPLMRRPTKKLYMLEERLDRTRSDFQSINLVARIIKFANNYNDGIVALVDPYDSTCQELIDGPLLAVMNEFEKKGRKNTIIINDYVGKEGEISFHRPYFNTLYIGNPEEISIKVE